MPSKFSCDLAIVGGGLSGALIALALESRNPGLDFRLIEESPVLGGDHVWSFFADDIAVEHRWLVAPLTEHMWAGHQVRFPARERRIAGGYYSILSERLDAHLRTTLPAEKLITGRRVAALTRSSVVLAGGDRIKAAGVIDARGPAELRMLDLGWQKFLGQLLVLENSHALDWPMVMDARVDQTDGYRFVYALPFAADRVFVEDTYYSDEALIDPARYRKRLADYAEAQGWRTAFVAREEQGVLPVCMGGDFEGYWHSGGTQVAKVGLRAALFHPLTGYSLPDAVRTAMLVADQADFSGTALHDVLFKDAQERWKERGFYRMLARMLFRAANPDERYKVLEHFYALDSGLVARFYAGRSTPLDKARILIGKPPVPIGRAIVAARGKAVKGLR